MYNKPWATSSGLIMLMIFSSAATPEIEPITHPSTNIDAMKEEYPPRRASERHNRFLPLRLCSSGTKAVARMWRLWQIRSGH